MLSPFFLLLALAQPSDPSREALQFAVEALADGKFYESMLAFEEVERDYPDTPAARAAPELARLALAYREQGAPPLPPATGTTAGSQYEYAFALLGHGRPIDALKILHRIRNDHREAPEAEMASGLMALAVELVRRDLKAPVGAKPPPEARGCLFFP